MDALRVTEICPKMFFFFQKFQKSPHPPKNCESAILFILKSLKSLSIQLKVLIKDGPDNLVSVICTITVFHVA